MIACFPEAYPDELAFSVFARYGERMGWGCPDVNEALFGEAFQRATMALPTRLDRFLASLPQGHPWPGDSFLFKHTLYPYHAAFMEEERRAAFRAAMLGEGGRAAWLAGGASRIGLWQRVPQYCRACVERDRGAHGAAYWRRVHQAPGVLICPAHGMPLERVPIESAGLLPYVTLERAVSLPTLQAEGLPDAWLPIALHLARDTARLLDGGAPYLDRQQARRRYERLLSERDLSNHGSRIHAQALLQQVREGHPRALLERLACPLPDRAAGRLYRNWSSQVLLQSGEGVHTLHHLLMIRFLGHTTDTFAAVPPDAAPFGDAPWPCLNPAADHYRAERVTECRVAGTDWGLVATFRCSCGFVYRRGGPDREPTDRYRVGRVLERGPLWDDRVRALWADTGRPLTSIQKELGLNREDLREYADRLGLPSARQGPASPPGPLAATGRPSSGAEPDAHRADRRARWLEICRGGPGASPAMLRRRSGDTHAWLLANDGEWLRRHTPDPPAQGRRIKIDWAARDEHFARSILGMAKAEPVTGNSPKRLSRIAVANALGTWDATFSDPRLPLTREALAAVVESPEAYASRRKASEQASWNSPEPSRHPIADAPGEGPCRIPGRGGQYPRRPRSPAT